MAGQMDIHEMDEWKKGGADGIIQPLHLLVDHDLADNSVEHSTPAIVDSESLDVDESASDRLLTLNVHRRLEERIVESGDGTTRGRGRCLSNARTTCSVNVDIQSVEVMYVVTEVVARIYEQTSVG